MNPPYNCRQTLGHYLYSLPKGNFQPAHLTYEYICWCEIRESNPYGIFYHGILNPECLPIPSISQKYINLFRNMVRMSTLRHRRVALMVVDWDTFVIHMLYFPHKFVGSLRKDQTHLATTCFGTLFHHPIAHIGTWHNLLGLEPTSSSFGDWRFTN